MDRHSVVERSRWLLFEHFEKVLVVLLVASLLLIHRAVDYKLAFLSFYYLPIIAAGFLAGRNTAVWSAVLIVNLVLFFQLVQGLEGAPGFDVAVTLTLVPWAGFLILTAFVVGALADQKQRHLDDVKQSYLTMLELLTFSLETADRQTQGHSHRIADLAATLANELGLREQDVENVRVAALMHEVGPDNPRLLALVGQFPGHIKGLPVTGALRGATTLLGEYGRYYEMVGDDWPVDQLPISIGAKILAVADAYDTLQLDSPLRPALAPWTAMDEIEKGAGKVFASEVVQVLRRVAGLPVRATREARFDTYAARRN
jgi:hypothetical protein